MSINSVISAQLAARAPEVARTRDAFFATGEGALSKLTAQIRHELGARQPAFADELVAAHEDLAAANRAGDAWLRDVAVRNLATVERRHQGVDGVRPQALRAAAEGGGLITGTPHRVSPAPVSEHVAFAGPWNMPQRRGGVH